MTAARRMPVLLAAVIACALLFSTGAEAREPTAIALGESHSLASRHLGDERAINIYLPSGYASDGKTYAVLYLIDGGLEQDFLHISGTSHLGSIWARSLPVIVVGIETKDRRRELIGPTKSDELRARYPNAGSSAAFRAFIREEVKPLVEKNYRTSGTDAVLGESLAGLFIVETYLSEPELFDAYAAVSPSLWWDDERLSREAPAHLAGPNSPAPRLYLTIANEGDEMQSGMDRLVAALALRADRTCYAPRPKSTHATIYHDVSPEALQYLFPTDIAHEAESGFIIPCLKES